MNSNGADCASAPADYSALFQQYYSYVVVMVRRGGIADHRAEDVAMEILLRFYERDFLNVYDPEATFTHQGVARKTQFKTFLTRFVVTYVRGYYDRQQRQAHREVLICDQFVGESAVDRWIDVHGGQEEDRAEEICDLIVEAALVEGIREKIAQVPRRSRYDKCDLLALFDAVIAQIRTDGVYSPKRLREQFSISGTAMHSWLKWLKTNIAAAMDRVGPVELAIDEEVAP